MTETPREYDMSFSLADIAKQYGPFAFGLVSLMVIWLTIMQPELTRRNLDFEQQQEVLSQQREITKAQRDISDSQAVTAKMIENSSESLAETANALSITTQKLQQIVTATEIRERNREE